MDAKSLSPFDPGSICILLVISLELQKVCFTYKYVQIELYQWQASVSKYTDKQAKEIVMFIVVYSIDQTSGETLRVNEIKTNPRKRREKEKQKGICKKERNSNKHHNRYDWTKFSPHTVDSHCCYYHYLYFSFLLYLSCRIPQGIQVWKTEKTEVRLPQKIQASVFQRGKEAERRRRNRRRNSAKISLFFFFLKPIFVFFSFLVGLACWGRFKCFVGGGCSQILPTTVGPKDLSHSHSAPPNSAVSPHTGGGHVDSLLLI